nr:non-ribosomal peptide synthetase [uncultured Rhodopila sp.]
MTTSGEVLARPEPASSNGGQSITRFNDTGADFPQVCAHELFEQQVARDPGAVALVFGQRQVSYGELNERANKVAHMLRKRGVGPDVLVGVCLERSPEMVVALLAVWKAGGAYVPLDPAYPPERLSFMLADSQTVLLLTEEKCSALFSTVPADKTIYLDAGWPLLARESAENLAPISDPSDLAYVMYTSGSTGQPKGAMILQRGLVNYLWWAIRAYAVEPGRSVPVHTSVAFDLTVTSLYTPLLAGGTVELLPEDLGAQNLLAALLRSGDRSLVKITPAHLELLNQQLRPEQAAGICRAFVIGGENLLAESLRLWRGLVPPTRLINEYGPTETVVGCSIYEVQPADAATGTVPIGRPIANTQLYVLDPDMQPVPPGVTGELYIGGAGVARGYLNRPELTAERFVPDTFGSVPGACLFRTGDLAQYQANGTLYCLGRADDQVKVRGYRIELGEIEAALAAHPKVRSCVVLAREDEPGNKQLVGYLVPRDFIVPVAADLRGFLKEKLPEYMVPAKFVYMDSLPLTPNGKFDRKALPPPLVENVSAGTGGSPRTETEKLIAAIWCDLLAINGIGIHDDYFDLGGDSMTAVRLLVRLHETFGVDLQLAALFDRPTIAGLAELVDSFVLTRRESGSGAAQREEFIL